MGLCPIAPCPQSGKKTVWAVVGEGSCGMRDPLLRLEPSGTAGPGPGRSWAWGQELPCCRLPVCALKSRLQAT